MAQALFHALPGLALPDFHGDAQGRDLQRADAAVFTLQAIYAGDGRLLGRAGHGEGGGLRRGIQAAAVDLRCTIRADAVAASALHGGHAGLEAPQDGGFHDAGLGGTQDAVLQLRDLKVHHVRLAVVVLGAVDVLVGGVPVVVLGSVCGKGIVRRQGVCCHGVEDEQRHDDAAKPVFDCHCSCSSVSWSVSGPSSASWSIRTSLRERISMTASAMIAATAKPPVM